jgi:hypothetical protein
LENYKLIYPNHEVAIYENYMNTAKLVWEEFTGSSNQPAKVAALNKKEKSGLGGVQFGNSNIGMFEIIIYS